MCAFRRGGIKKMHQNDKPTKSSWNMAQAKKNVLQINRIKMIGLYSSAVSLNQLDNRREHKCWIVAMQQQRKLLSRHLLSDHHLKANQFG